MGEVNQTNNGLDSEDTLHLKSKIINGCILTNDLISEHLIYLASIILSVLLLCTLILTINHIQLFHTVTSVSLITLIYATYFTLAYALVIELRLVKLIRKQYEMGYKKAICDNKEKFNEFKKIVDVIRSNPDIDPIVLWLAQGKIGIVKFILVLLLIIISGEFTLYFILNGAYMSPFLYLIGIVLILLLRKLFRFIFAVISLKINEDKNIH